MALPEDFSSGWTAGDDIDTNADWEMGHTGDNTATTNPIVVNTEHSNSATVDDSANSVERVAEYTGSDKPTSTDQWAECDCEQIPSHGSMHVGPIIRMDSTYDNYYFAGARDSTGLNLFKTVSGSISSVAAAGTGVTADGDTVYLEFDGSDYDVKVNNVSQLTGADSSITSGTIVGMHLRGRSSGSFDVAVGRFNADDLGAAPPAGPHPGQLVMAVQ